MESERRKWAAENARVVAELRQRGERTGDQPRRGHLLILHTTGARSGQPRCTPLGYVTAGDRYYVIDGTAFYGATRKPDWYHNLRADPRVTIEVGPERFPAIARELAGDEREGIWARFKERLSPAMVDFAEEGQRTLPIVELAPTTQPSTCPLPVS